MACKTAACLCAILLVVTGLEVSVATLEGSDCKELEILPFATDDVVCGYKMVQVPASGGLSQADILSNPRLGAGWMNLDFDDSTWDMVSMPLGYKVDQCAMLSGSYSADPTYWAPNSAVFVRRKFYVDPDVYHRLQSIKIEYLVDDAMAGIYVNGEKQGSYPLRQQCSAAIDSVSVSKADIEVGDNVVAVYGIDKGAQTFMNIRVTVQICPEGSGSIEYCSRVHPQRCRRPCLDQDDMCQNYDCGSTESYAADITGDCLCEMKMGLHCAGPFQETDGCYPSQHTVALSSVKISCPTPRETCAPPQPPPKPTVPPLVCEQGGCYDTEGHVDYEVVGNSMSYHEARDNCAQKYSSSASLALPNDATVKSAHLYWSGSGTSAHTLTAKLNGVSISAQKSWTGGYQSYQFYGAMTDVTHLVSGSGQYTVANLFYDNSYYLCRGNAAYAAWVLIVVYEKASLPNARINFCYDNFRFTFPQGTYQSKVDCISRVGTCVSQAVTTVVTFESDAYKGEYFYLGQKYMGNNIFRGSTAPNLDIREFDVSYQVNTGISSLVYKLKSYYTNTIYGAAVEGLFMPVRIVKYTRTDCH